MISVTEIQAAVAGHYGLNIRDMRSGCRARRVAHPRQVGMYLSRQLTKQSYPRIGRLFGGRDHSTIMHGERAARERLKRDPVLAEDVWAIAAELVR
jgi:chromosomal replication initiator protein